MAKIQKTTAEQKAREQANIDRARRLAQQRLDEIEKRRATFEPKE
jgi:hypothetical protein